MLSIGAELNNRDVYLFRYVLIKWQFVLERAPFVSSLWPGLSSAATKGKVSIAGGSTLGKAPDTIGPDILRLTCSDHIKIAFVAP